MQGSRRAGVPFLLILVADLLLVAAPAAAVDKYSGRVVVNYAAAGSTRGNASAHHAVTALMRQRLKDEVAPELISSRWPAGLGAGNGYKNSYGSLNPTRPVCQGSCGGGGAPYTPNHCTSYYHCRQ